MWVASALSIQTGGPGTAYAGTTVCLNQRNEPSRPILMISQQFATINLRMRWLDSAHLELAYGPSTHAGDKVSVDFQATRFASVTISLRRLPDDSLR